MNRVNETVERVYQLAWADDLTPAESRLVWLNVIAKLLETERIDRQKEAIKEWLKL